MATTPNTFTATTVVTGAAGGMGRYTAEMLASRGMCLLLADIKGEEVKRIAADLALRYEIRAYGLEIDITKEEQVKAMVQAATSLTGRLDYAANCAGVLFETPGGNAD